MSLLGNLLWIVLGGGLFLCLFYLLGGIVLCLTIVGIPFGVQLFKLAGLSLSPFGRTVGEGRALTGPLSILMNILWIVFGGFEVAVVHLVFGVLNAVTVIGLPFARQHLKLASLAFIPFGRRIR